MDLGSHLPPPSFYLSSPKMGKLWLFTDVPIFPEAYRSQLNSQALPGMNDPYVSQGHGLGTTWAFEAKLNPWHAFLADGASTSAREAGSSVYAEYVALRQFIADYGPSPLLVLHMPGRAEATVALQSLESEIALQQDTLHHDGQLPSTIPVQLVLVKVADYRVRFD